MKQAAAHGNEGNEDAGDLEGNRCPALWPPEPQIGEGSAAGQNNAHRSEGAAEDGGHAACFRSNRYPSSGIGKILENKGEG